MESAAWQPAKTNRKKPRQVCLTIFPDGSSTPTFKASWGVTSVALTATGKFTVTLTGQYWKLRAGHCTYGTSADDVDLYAQLGVIANLASSSAVTVVVKLKTGATNTDAAAAGADNRICVTLEFEDSSAFDSVSTA